MKSSDFANPPALRGYNSHAPIRHVSGGRPRVSIVTPFWNPGKAFESTVSTVLRQTLSDWEWIIVDDASRCAESLMALAEIVSRDDRVSRITLEHNRGPSFARNRGLEAARANYIFWLDADDQIEPNALEKCYWRLERFPASSFVKGFTVGFGTKQFLWTGGFHEREAFLRENRATITAMVRTSVARAIGGFDERISGGLEDWDFWIRAANANFWGFTVREPLDWYLQRPQHRDRWQNLRADTLILPSVKHARKRGGAFAATPDSLLVGAQTVRPVGHEGGPAGIILFVSNFALGGADRFALDVVKFLTRDMGFKVTIICSVYVEGGWTALSHELCDDIFYLESLAEAGSVLSLLEFVIANRRPSAFIISHSVLAYTILPWLRSVFPQTAVYDILHIVSKWRNGGFPGISSRVCDSITASFCTSENLRGWVETATNGERRTIKILTGVPPVDQSVAAKPNRIERLTILYAARFCEEKRPYLLEKVMACSQRLGLELHLIIAGAGPLQDVVDQIVASYEHADYVGPVAPEQMKNLYMQSDVILLPSCEEGIALTLIEAMAYGVVPMATRVGGQEELIGSDRGFLLDDDDHLLAGIMSALTQLVADAQFRCRLSQNARTFVQHHFSIDAWQEPLRNELSNLPPNTSECPIMCEKEGRWRICEERVSRMLNFSVRKDDWNGLRDKGSLGILIISQIYSFASTLPLFGRFVRRFNILYGERVGALILRAIRGRAS